ncbi:hypothetical protein L1987_05143 [Smallanthus sonchifolius]|uniref:Uncharacterized protein n=1 Tax=Smallanthus sonchifolius TaxID=185202 RepID=A0ACB9JUP4_9ASTR|nr:hypothetical protein L1987_05143 [Smallanthus sonchifolius]
MGRRNQAAAAVGSSEANGSGDGDLKNTTRWVSLEMMTATLNGVGGAAAQKTVLNTSVNRGLDKALALEMAKRGQFCHWMLSFSK